MPSKRPICLSLALGLALVGAGCGTSPADRAPARPLAAIGSRPANEEERLWARSVEEQARLDASGFRAELPEVERTLAAILARLAPEPLPTGGDYEIRVLVDPSLNAFAYPNGVIFLHTGLLARAENEAQIAAVLAHEAAHAWRRHGLLHQRQTRGATGFAATLTVGTLGLGGVIGHVGALAAISGYSKEYEREADQLGFAHFIAAGYDPRESVAMFRLLLAEAKRTKLKEPFFFGSHPRLEERIASHEALIAALPPERQATGVTHSEAYTSVLAQILPVNAAAALRAGDTEGALADAARGSILTPDEPGLRLIEADALRRRKKGDDAERAHALYQALTTQHPELPEAWRGLGLGAQSRAEWPAAVEAFRRYLALAPTAPDRELIQSLLTQCETLVP